MNQVEFTKQHFIDKFSAIPDDKWTTGKLTNYDDPECHCALGHCGVEDYEKPTDEALALIKLFGGKIAENSDRHAHGDTQYEVVYRVNDFHDSGGNQEPKKNILEKLESI